MLPEEPATCCPNCEHSPTPTSSPHGSSSESTGTAGNWRKEGHLTCGSVRALFTFVGRISFLIEGTKCSFFNILPHLQMPSPAWGTSFIAPARDGILLLQTHMAKAKWNKTKERDRVEQKVIELENHYFVIATNWVRWNHELKVWEQGHHAASEQHSPGYLLITRGNFPSHPSHLSASGSGEKLTSWAPALMKGEGPASNI